MPYAEPYLTSQTCCIMLKGVKHSCHSSRFYQTLAEPHRGQTRMSAIKILPEAVHTAGSSLRCEYVLPRIPEFWDRWRTIAHGSHNQLAWQAIPPYNHCLGQQFRSRGGSFPRSRCRGLLWTGRGQQSLPRRSSAGRIAASYGRSMLSAVGLVPAFSRRSCCSTGCAARARAGGGLRRDFREHGRSKESRRGSARPISGREPAVTRIRQFASLTSQRP